MQKINLVTVVGDFHQNLTLVQMLNHYKHLVDEIYIKFYITSGIESPVRTERFVEYLEESGVLFSNINISTYIGQKFDWDQVTNLYNETTALDPDAFWIISDCDEFQYWPDSPRSVAEHCVDRGYTFVTGGFLDRIGENGCFPKITGPDCDLDQIFPMIGFFRYPMSGACPNKVVMVKGGQKVCSGQHYAIFPDGTNSWGSKYILRYPIEECFVQVHHFKWDSSILKRLQDVSRSRCKYSEEYAKMKEGIDVLGHIDINKNSYLFERYDSAFGYDSYRHWNRVRKIIVGV